MMCTGKWRVLFFVTLAMPLVSFAALYRDISLGARGEDVRELQQLLNTVTETRIAESGPGSPGQETDYFGELTHAAVVRYQNLFAADILYPLGLSSGTGYVGVATRNHLGGEPSTAFPDPIGVTPGAPPPAEDSSVTEPEMSRASADGPTITSIDPESGGVGTVVTIRGEGFLGSDNNVVSAFEEWRGISSRDGETLTITVKGPFPEDFLEANADFYEERRFEMEYQLVVTNDSGYSNFVPFTFLFYE